MKLALANLIRHSPQPKSFLIVDSLSFVSSIAYASNKTAHRVVDSEADDANVNKDTTRITLPMSVPANIALQQSLWQPLRTHGGVIGCVHNRA